jgi:hypothetical protein
MITDSTNIPECVRKAIPKIESVGPDNITIPIIAIILEANRTIMPSITASSTLIVTPLLSLIKIPQSFSLM